MIENIRSYIAERKYPLLIAAIVVAAFAVRVVTSFGGPLEYDEIWTLSYIEKPVGGILTDLATPNNHPLNTLFVKLWWNCFEVPQLIRLHSLIFGVLSVLLTGMLARGLFHSRAAALFSMVFLALDAAAVNYSGLARGYMTQLFFLLLFACGIAWSGRLRRFLPWKEHLPEAAMIAGALGAVLTVPTAPIFLAAIVIAARIYRRKMPETSVMLAVGVAAALVVGYLAINYAALRTARRDFGSDFSWLGFVVMIFQDFCALGVAPFLIVLAATDRRRGLLIGWCAAAIVLSPAFTSAGPPRVYLPLCVLVALGCGQGAHMLITVALCRDNRKLAKIIAVSAVFLAGLGYYQLKETWAVTDYWGWFQAGQSMPHRYLVVYPAAAGNPLVFNNAPELAKDQLARLADDSLTGRRLLCFGVEPGTINGGDLAKPQLPEAVMKLPVNGNRLMLNGFPAVEYQLFATELPAPGAPFVAVGGFDPVLRAIDGTKGGALCLNQFFIRVKVPPMLFCSAAPEDAERREQLRGSGARFYVFVPDGGGAARP